MKFDIKIMGEIFESDDNGFLNLNDIHKGLGLPEARIPSKWRNEFSREFKRLTKLVSVNGNNGGTWADEQATIAYASWVSVEFFLSVTQAFVELRRGNVEGALQHAASTMSEESADKMMQVVWDNLNGMKVINQRTALQLAGIEHPITFMRELRKRSKYYERMVADERILLQTFAPSKWTERFTQKGFQWLLDNKDKMNSWVDEVQYNNKQLSKMVS